MKPAFWPAAVHENRILVIDAPKRKLRVEPLDAIIEFVRPGDLWIVNDVSTFPASLQGKLHGRSIEIRLLPNPTCEIDWPAVLLGEGSWHDRTEDRAAPPSARVGDWIQILGASRDFSVQVSAVSNHSTRSVRLKLALSSAVDLAKNLEDAWDLIYRYGKPVQYSYLTHDLELWDVQNLYAGAPWASEMPSAGRALNARMIEKIRAKKAEIASLSHSTGLSSTGDPKLDEVMPGPEYSALSQELIDRIYAAHAKGGRIIAVGTSVARAIEGRSELGKGKLYPGGAWTSLVLSEQTPIRWFDGILTGVHEVSESHFRLLKAFVSEEFLSQALKLAETSELRTHEFGDFSLVLRETEKAQGSSCQSGSSPWHFQEG